MPYAKILQLPGIASAPTQRCPGSKMSPVHDRLWPPLLRTRHEPIDTDSDRDKRFRESYARRRNLGKSGLHLTGAEPQPANLCAEVADTLFRILFLLSPEPSNRTSRQIRLGSGAACDRRCGY